MATIPELMSVFFYLFPPIAPPCREVPPSSWRPPTGPAEVLPAAFRRGAREARPEACVVPVCHARVRGTSGGFLAQDVPDVAIELIWNRETFVGRGKDDAREAWVMGPFHAAWTGLGWEARVLDMDGLSDEQLTRQRGFHEGQALSFEADDVKFECRFLAAADRAALAGALGKAIVADANTLARSPGKAQTATVARLLGRLDLFTASVPPESPVLKTTIESARAALERWARPDGVATVARSGVTFKLAPDAFALLLEGAPSITTPVTFGRVEGTYHFNSFATWIDLASPVLAHGTASPSGGAGDVTVAAGQTGRLFYSPSGTDNPSRGDPILVGTWQKGFMGNEQSFVLRR